MRWPQELSFLEPVEQIYRRESALRILLCSAVALLGANAIFNLVTVLVPAPFFGRAAVSLIVLLVAAGGSYCWRPNLLELSRRMDRELESDERIQTYLELRAGKDTTAATGQPGREGEEMTGRLLAELGRYFRDHPPRARFNWRAFRSSATLFSLAALLFAITFLASPALSSTLASGQEKRAALEEALAAMDELEQLLPPDPLLKALREELAFLREQIQFGPEPAEVELLLRETLEALESQREELARIAAALQEQEDLWGDRTASEIAVQLENDPFFREEFLKQLEQLARAVPPGALRETLQGTAANLTGVSGDGLSGAVEALDQIIASMDPVSAGRAVRAGAEHLRERQQALAGGSTGGGDQNATGTGAPGGDSTAGSAGGGENGKAGDSGGGKEGGGSGAGSGEGSGGGGDDGSGGGAGTGSAPPKGHQFFFIPGEQEIILGGTGEESGYTLPEILRLNPGLSSEEYAGQYQHYYRQGTTSLQEGHVPPSLENYVRSYFEAIAP